MDKRIKPIGRPAYGSIAHLPGSRMGIGDKRITDGQAKICWEKTRDKNDLIVVQEKLDGSCCAIAIKDGELIALQRSGYDAKTSPYKQHHIFHDWMIANKNLFSFLKEGERVVGEWLAQVHSTRYSLFHDPFVCFDLYREKRVSRSEFLDRTINLAKPHEFHVGGSFSKQDMFKILSGESKHGGERIEGVIYRVYRNDEIDFLAKYVRDDFEPGKYLTEKTGNEEIWNWSPF